MDLRQAAAIDLVEASYNLELPPAEWLPSLLEVGDPIFAHSLGYYGVVAAGASEQGVPIFTQVHASLGAEDLPMKIMRAARETGPELVGAISTALNGSVTVLSEVRDRWPEAHDILTKNIGCKDILSIVAVDPDSHGVSIIIPSPELIELTSKQREYWQMLGVHLAAGHRLRRGLGEQGDVAGLPVTDIPLDAEALLDPKQFLVTHAVGGAREAEASRTIREAARVIDQARGALRKRDPAEALRLWEGLVRGRWTLVDWFDTDGRRFVLAKPNTPDIGDPRGLNQREAQVATYASRGETNKMIGYRLGLSPAYVSRLVNDAMRKLSVKTRPQLVERMRAIPTAGLATKA